MATYAEIQDFVRKRAGRTVKTCWIAHVKELLGLTLRRAPNRSDPKHRLHPCPEWARPLIETALSHLP